MAGKSTKKKTSSSSGGRRGFGGGEGGFGGGGGGDGGGGGGGGFRGGGVGKKAGWGGGWAGPSTPPSSSSAPRPSPRPRPSPSTSSAAAAPRTTTPAGGAAAPAAGGVVAPAEVPNEGDAPSNPDPAAPAPGGAHVDVADDAPAEAAPARSPPPRREEEDEEEDGGKYYALVVDSGAIIKHAGYSTLHNAAERYVTVPAVMDEIRDQKAREHLDALPFDLATRQPSPEATVRVAEFARKTGDYRSLSRADLQVLALLYDMEVEGCGGDVSHVRKEPKRALTGRIRSLNAGDGRGKKGGKDEGNGEAARKDNSTEAEAGGGGEGEGETAAATAAAAVEKGVAYFGGRPEAPANEAGGEDAVATAAAPKPQSKLKPASWAQLVDPSAAAPADAAAPASQLGAMNLSAGSIAAEAVSFASVVEEQEHEEEEEDLGGQFDDASEEDDGEWLEAARARVASAEAGGGGGGAESDEDDDDDDDKEEGRMLAGLDSDDDDSAGISDEECDVIVLEPEEAEERRRAREAAEAEGALSGAGAGTATAAAADPGLAADLASDFPSLAAASAVPYEGSDDDDGDGDKKPLSSKKGSYWDEEEEKRKAASLAPVPKTKDGRLYNSFRGYGHVVKKAGVARVPTRGRGGGGGADADAKERDEALPEIDAQEASDGSNEAEENAHKSRIIGGAAALSGQSDMPNDEEEDDDDGEGWIESPSDLRAMRAAGALDPARSPGDVLPSRRGGGGGERAAVPTEEVAGPPRSKRAACATTDFAMQNVILQMGLTVLTVDGVRVRRVKSWVTRCDACYTVYAAGESSQASGELGRRGLDRMFCDRCGSGALSRIACSVDGRTGRLKLHLSRRYRHNTRGSKYSLPKPGKGNRFEGDLLLSEDQLLYGAWNQKVKKGSGRREAESAFGSGVASDVGCRAGLKRDDIKVGFGRRNPNAAKFGRERRGKKKKSADSKACGLRRY